MSRGWIKLDRSFNQWQWRFKPNMVTVFIYLLLEAQKEDYVQGDITIPRGCVLTSLEKISKGTGLSIQQTRTCISNMQSTCELTCKSTNKGTLIRIVNWDKFQGGSKKSTYKSTSTLNENQQAESEKSTCLIVNKNIYNKKTRRDLDKMPTYDTSKNKSLTEEEKRELISLRRSMS